MEQQITNSDKDKFKIELKGESFIDMKIFINSPSYVNENIIDTTEPSTSGDLIVPSVYIVPNKDITFDGTLAIPGLLLVIISFTNKVAFCLQTYNSPYIKNFDPKSSMIFPFLIIDRKNIREFNIDEDKKYKALKPKKSQQFAINLGSGFWGTVGGLVPMLFVKGAFNLVAKAEEDNYEKTGTIFHLTCKKEDRDDFTISIACEDGYRVFFTKLLQDNWTSSIPDSKEITEEDYIKILAETFKIGNNVKFPSFFTHTIGTVIKKEKDYAVIKVITKKGEEKTENIKYGKLTKIRE